MRIEDELRGALDVAAPPPTTQLDDVLRRGKRRVTARRAGIAGGALAMVAVVGIGVVAYRPAGPMLPLDTNPANWSPASVAERRLPDPPRPDEACRGTVARVSVHPAGGEVPSIDQMRTWRNTTQSLLRGGLVDSELPEDVANRGGSVFTVSVVDDQGAGSVRFSTVRFTGSPVEAADTALWATGECSPPRRVIGDDGTVFQLYDDSGPRPQAQCLSIFRPDGRAVRVEQVISTRETLPLTDTELVKLGAAVAEVL